MKKNIFNVLIFAFAILCLALSLMALVYSAQNQNGPTVSEIYGRCVNNVLEVKAESENVGESFGTAELMSSDGTLVTNAHVVTYTKMGAAVPFQNIYVRFSSSEEYLPADLIKFDTALDLAVIKISVITGLNLTPVTTGDSSALKSGQKVYAVGNAANYGVGIFQGLISIPLVNIKIDNVTKSVIQCDLTVAAGNSGGALLNENGKLIGITTFRTKDNLGNVIYGIVYCIPINTVLDYINNI